MDDNGISPIGVDGRSRELTIDEHDMFFYYAIRAEP